MASEAASATQSSPRFVAVGAGRMGRGLAIAFAYAGRPVAVVDLRDRSDIAWQALADDVRAEVAGALRGLVELGAVRDDQVRAISERINLVRAAQASEALQSAEMVFECLTETLEAKQAGFEQINRWCADDAIVTSTTSTMSVSQLAGLVRRPERFFNMHWLNPAYVIPVVELSTHATTDPTVVERTRQIMESIGKVPVVCRADAGYIVSRLQALIMNEAARMVEEGAATAEEIDKATRYGLGLRFAALGVVEFIDFGGCDILFHASREMSRSIDAERYRAPDILNQMMERNHLGLKTASGFYAYEGRDLKAYRRDVLERTLGMVRHLGLFHAPAENTK
ncbi:MAG TPA: 3-hydroxybutyryl-CoA dehydrogenase [Nevskiaceae bacterium]